VVVFCIYVVVICYMCCILQALHTAVIVTVSACVVYYVCCVRCICCDLYIRCWYNDGLLALLLLLVLCVAVIIHTCYQQHMQHTG